MSKPKTTPVTIEEAVALMVNMNYIPTGFSLLDMTDAFWQEANFEHHNALIDRLPEEQILTSKFRMDSCRSRHTLAQRLIKSLQSEVKNPDTSIIILPDDSLNNTLLALESVSDWAADRFGINILIPTPVDSNTNVYSANGHTPAEDVKVRWEEVTIKIYADYRIGYSPKKGKFQRSTFREIGLMGQLKNEPNFLGGLLIGISKERKFPTGNAPEPREKTAVSKLRLALKKLTGLEEDPFLPFNEDDGWKPRFKLIDDRRNADDRAKEKATHVSFDESKDYNSPEARDFDVEKDDAQRWLDEQK